MMINRDKMPIRILLDGRAFEFSNAELSGEDLKTEAGLRDDWTLFQITESGLFKSGRKNAYGGRYGRRQSSMRKNY